MTIKLDELERLAKAATPEDWFPETYSTGHRQVCGNLRPVDEDEDAYTVVADVYKREDHEYLVAAQPKAMLELIAEVRRLREALSTPLLTGADAPMYGGIFGAEGVNRDVAETAFYTGAPTVTVYYGEKRVYTNMAAFCAAHPREKS